MREALYYQLRDDGRVHCRLCPHHCLLKDGDRGVCRVRQHLNGVLYTFNYGQAASYALDPIEKKPLYHYYPGSYLFSLGALGCNLECAYCQNWQISQREAPTIDLGPSDAVSLALRARRQQPASIGIAYTYSEPSVWFEFVFDTARLARGAGLRNVMVTNGYLELEPLQELLGFMDAFNVDVKSFDSHFYKKVCHGQLQPVLRFVEAVHAAGKHVEVTNLIVPSLNDSDEQIGALVDWLADISPSIPLHFSRYFPDYRLDLPPTPLGTLERARETALRKLRYVYLGNAWGNHWNNTYCHGCGEPLILRNGLGAKMVGVVDHRCKRCGEPAAMVY